MIRVLVIGLTKTLGGIETYLKNLLLHSNKDEIIFDYLIKGDEKPVFYENICEFYGGEHFFYVTKIKKNIIKCYFEMRKICSENKYDIIYINTTTSSDILYSTLFSSNTPVVMHSHFYSNCFRLPNVLFKKMCREKSVKMLACSEKAAEWLFGKNNQALIINNGIDTNHFRFSLKARALVRNRHGIDNNTFVIGNVARLSYEKNHVFLLRVLYEMLQINKSQKTYKDIVLIICGDGPEKKKLDEYIEKLGITKNVIMTGIIDSPELYYSCFDAFVLPSKYEGMPVSGIEAQCSGLPCFFSDRMDKKILISDRASEIHLENNNQKYWANTIYNICSEQYTQRDTYCEIIAGKGYDIKNVSEKVISELKEIAKLSVLKN